jgi:HK97 family phage major capsid protein
MDKMQTLIDTANSIRAEVAEFKALKDNEDSPQDDKDQTIIEEIQDIIERHRDSYVPMSYKRPSGSAQEELPKSDAEKRYQQAFINYLRKGDDHSLSLLESKLFSRNDEKSMAPDNGFSITSSMSHHLNRTLQDLCVMRQVATVTKISTEALELVYDETQDIAGWDQDITSILSDENSTKLSRLIIPTHYLYAQPKALQKTVDDPRMDVENWLSRKLVEIFAREEDMAFIKGDGLGKPRGILSYPSGTKSQEIEQISSSSGITYEGLLKLYFALDSAYLLGAAFVVSRSAMQAIRTLKDTTTGRFLWQPSLADGMPDTLFGLPIYLSPNMPEVDDKVYKTPIALGNFRLGYQIVDRGTIRTLRDPYTNKPYVKFYTTKQVGGAVVESKAIKLLKI